MKRAAVLSILAVEIIRLRRKERDAWIRLRLAEKGAGAGHRRYARLHREWKKTIYDRDRLRRAPGSIAEGEYAWKNDAVLMARRALSGTDIGVRP